MSKRITRPNTSADAAAVLDLQPRSGRRYAALGLFGRTRKPTKEERQKFAFPANTRIVCDMGVVQRLKKRREKEGVLAVMKSARKARRRA